MTTRKRVRPTQAGTRISNVQPFSVREFFARFPSDDACLEHVMEVRYGLRHVCEACGKDATFHRLANRHAFSCAACGHHVYPCAGTIFQDSRTPLQSWFYAVYLFIATRHGVSGKELQRTLGVTYKTAWRMGQQIRKLMSTADGLEVLKGHIEIDEAYVGGRRHGKTGRGAAGKTIVMGFKERGGRMVTEVIPNIKTATLREVFFRTVEPGARISTDELYSYGLLEGAGFVHGTVTHAKKEYARGEDHVNHVESFWKLFKASIRSTHIHVSARSNHRQMGNAMFDLLIAAL
jgi:transposase-like protein